jgi:hypothetical protein
MKKTTARGGKRPGAGRKAGSGNGRQSISRTISMPQSEWNRLDAIRGTQSRGKFLAQRF